MFCSVIVFGTAAASYLGTVVTDLRATENEMLPSLPPSLIVKSLFSLSHGNITLLESDHDNHVISGQ